MPSNQFVRALEHDQLITPAHRLESAKKAMLELSVYSVVGKMMMHSIQNVQMELTSLLREPEIADEEFATLVDDFHGITQRVQARAVVLAGVERAMYRLEAFPRPRAELFYRSILPEAFDGWRPIGDRERALGQGWIEELGMVHAGLAARAVQVGLA